MSRRTHTTYRSTTVTSRSQRVGIGRILLHTILTCLTGGLWLVLLIIRYVIR